MEIDSLKFWEERYEENHYGYAVALAKECREQGVSLETRNERYPGLSAELDKLVKYQASMPALGIKLLELLDKGCVTEAILLAKDISNEDWWDVTRYWRKDHSKDADRLQMMKNLFYFVDEDMCMGLYGNDFAVLLWEFGDLVSIHMDYYFMNEDGSIAKEPQHNHAILMGDLIVKNSKVGITYTKMKRPGNVIENIVKALETKGVHMVALDGDPDEFEDWDNQLTIEIYNEAPD